MKLRPKSVKALAMLPKRKYFSPASADDGCRLVECGHNVKRETGQLEPDEDHEQFFAPDEQQQSDRREQNHREIFALFGAVLAAREE